MTTDRQHLENCVKRSTRLTGTISRLTQLKARASHHEQQFDALVREALGPQLYAEYLASQKQPNTET